MEPRPKGLWQRLKRPPWRTLILLLAIPGLVGVMYLLWTPGSRVLDGRHDLGTNGIWIGHGWLGDDAWFERNSRDKGQFRSAEKIKALADLLRAHGIGYVFPHVCPCERDGTLSTVDANQTERFLDHLEGVAVVPWIGGVLDKHCRPDDPAWRAKFIASAASLLDRHSRLAGVQVNIEPLPGGHEGFLLLLDELRAAMPKPKILSVAAYPPATRLHPVPEVHWEEAYFREVARRCDLLVPMMYDTALEYEKLYIHLMAGWTREVLEWSEGTRVLLGLPAYDDAGVDYHFPHVENLANGLAGIHAGLERFDRLPSSYRGIAIYCAWEMDKEKWTLLGRELGRPR